MRKFNPIHLAAAVAIALSGTTVLAQTTGGTLRVALAPTASTSTPTPSSSATPATGGCVGTGGSSCTATTSSTSGDTTTSSTGTTATPTPGVRSDSSANAPPTILESPNQSAGGVPGDAGFAGNPSQQNIVIQQQPAPQPEARTSSTPLLDPTARAAQSRETRRRNAKQEPRIIGIAPNTDRDLSYQMPDDRIIRY